MTKEESIEWLPPNQAKLFERIGEWTKHLLSDPDYSSWKKEQVKATLRYGEPDFDDSEIVEDFDLPSDDLEQIELIRTFFELHNTVESLKHCEYYFRRFPFREFPITKQDHLANVCELYFGKFYQFKERLRQYINIVNSICAPNKINGGEIIKNFNRTFSYELKQRNEVHHKERYSDIEIQKIGLTDILTFKLREFPSLADENRAAYRRACKEWTSRVRNRSKKLDEFLEEIARFTIEENILKSKAQSK